MRQQLSEDTFVSFWQQGREMSLDSVVTFALDNVGDIYPSPTE
jgi:hypothetical protein